MLLIGGKCCVDLTNGYFKAGMNDAFIRFLLIKCLSLSIPEKVGSKGMRLLPFFPKEQSPIDFSEHNGKIPNTMITAIEFLIYSEVPGNKFFPRFISFSRWPLFSFTIIWGKMLYWILLMTIWKLVDYMETIDRFIRFLLMDCFSLNNYEMVDYYSLSYLMTSNVL